MAAPLILPIALGFFVTWLVLYGMTHGLQTWLASFLNALAHPQGSLWKRAALLPVSLLAQAGQYVFRTVGHAISQVASHGIPRIAHYFGSWTVWVQHHAATLGDFAAETATGFERLVSHTIPHVVAREIAPVFRGIDHLEHEVRSLAHRLATYARGIDRLLKHFVLPQIHRLAHAVDVAIPHSIGGVRQRVGAIERRLTHPSKSYIKRIWKAGWVLVGAGLVLKFLVKKFPWLFCRNVTKAAKAVCRAPNSIIDLLLGEAFGLLVLSDICLTVSAIEVVAEGFEPILKDLVIPATELVDYCGHDLPTGSDKGGYSGPWLATGT